TQLLDGRSASIDALSVARESPRVHSNSLQAFCDADENSASRSRKCNCLEPQARALNQRSSEDAKVRIMISKNLNRRRKRRPGRSKRIPDISLRLWLRSTGLQVEPTSRGSDAALLCLGQGSALPLPR